MKAIVLIADIISSKEIEDRDKVQKNLTAELKKINKKSVSILSPMTITLGDEFQCVYSNADDVFRHIWDIMSALYPQKIRFSYGIGKIITGINRKQAIGMDGPAFHEAREGLLGLKQQNYYFGIRNGNNNSVIPEIISNTLKLVSNNVRGWNQNRIRIMNLLAYGKDIRWIAGKLGISEQAVYKNISYGGLKVMIDLSENIKVILNNWIKE